MMWLINKTLHRFSPNFMHFCRQTDSNYSFLAETFSCYLNEDQTAIEFFLGLRFYQHPQVSSIDYLAFIGSGTHAAPGDDGVFDYIDDANCAANTNSLAFAGTPLAQDLRSFTTPIADGLGNCGVQVVSNLVLQLGHAVDGIMS